MGFLFAYVWGNLYLCQMKTNTIIKTGVIFFVIGIFSTHISSVLCWLWLDDMTCYLQMACNVWDKFEYIIAHKAFSILFYYVGLYGFVGSILYYLEVKYLSKYLSKIIDVSSGIFGWVLTTIVCTVILNYVADALCLNFIFESLYNTFN